MDIPGLTSEPPPPVMGETATETACEYPPKSDLITPLVFERRETKTARIAIEVMPTKIVTMLSVNWFILVPFLYANIDKTTSATLPKFAAAFERSAWPAAIALCAVCATSST